MAEDAESPQGSQAVELLKLFQQVGRSFVGLFLLEIGWTVILVLAAKLTGEEHGPPAIGTLRLTSLWIYGGLVILVFWGFYSRLISYLMAPVFIVLKRIFDMLFLALAILCGLLDWALSPAVRWARQKLIKRQLRADRKTWIEKNLETGSASTRRDAERNYDAWLARVKQKIGSDMRVDKKDWLEKHIKEHGGDEAAAECDFTRWSETARLEYAERMIETLAADKVPLKEENLGNFVQLLGQYFISPIHSSIGVGIAPLVRYSHGQELVFERAPLQQFGIGIAAARERLRNLKGLDHISLNPLPSLLRIETEGRARFARWFFQLEALIWGRYIHDEEGVAQVHITTSAARKIDDRSVTMRHQQRIFPHAINSDFLASASAFTFSPQATLEAHIAICILLLHALVRRNEKGLPKILVGWDRSALSSSTDARRVLTHLAFDVLPLVEETPASAAVLPTVAMALADIVSRWVGYQLEDTFRMEDEDKRIVEQPELFIPQLHRVVTVCAKLLPSGAEHFYRLGALSCLMGNQVQAIDEFGRAAKLDRNSERVDPISANVLARSALDDANTARWNEKDLALARFASHAACAIGAGGEKYVRETMKNAPAIADLKYIAAADVNPAIKVVQHLLAEADAANTGAGN